MRYKGCPGALNKTVSLDLGLSFTGVCDGSNERASRRIQRETKRRKHSDPLIPDWIRCMEHSDMQE